MCLTAAKKKPRQATAAFKFRMSGISAKTTGSLTRSMQKREYSRDFLCETDLLVTDVKSLLSHSSNFATAARLKDIQGRLADEIRTLERLIAAQ
jgi:hypothetical protein